MGARISCARPSDMAVRFESRTKLNTLSRDAIFFGRQKLRRYAVFFKKRDLSLNTLTLPPPGKRQYPNLRTHLHEANIEFDPVFRSQCIALSGQNEVNWVRHGNWTEHYEASLDQFGRYVRCGVKAR